jgi:2-deoxy-D-gluconate 3-dehydrogenase
VNHLFDISGTTALVTGARRGIGFSMATALAAAGADIIAVSANLESRGSDIEKAILALGREFEAHQVDFADPEAVAIFSSSMRNRRIDILINNAGTIRRSPAAEHTDADFSAVLQINLASQFTIAREIGAGMLERGRGKIVFTASLLSFQGGINVPGYTAAKSGIAGLTKALANEWAGRGVQVNAIAPGYIATDNTAALRHDAARAPAILDRIPAGRWGTPEDLAGATVFLSSPASDYINGILLPVDGGWLGR